MKRTKKGDFVELDFTARIKDGEIFDTTIKEEALKAGLIAKEGKHKFEPLNICIGQGMVIKGLDRELEGKEEGKRYVLELRPEDAFGVRNPKAIRAFPLSVFKERPIPGTLVNVDGVIAKVLSVGGGRATLDFNSPLAGKNIVYEFKLNKIIEKKEKKVEIIARMFGLKTVSVKVDDGRAMVKFKEKVSTDVVKKLGKKIKELLNLELISETK